MPRALKAPLLVLSALNVQLLALSLGLGDRSLFAPWAVTRPYLLVVM